MVDFTSTKSNLILLKVVFNYIIIINKQNTVHVLTNNN